MYQLIKIRFSEEELVSHIKLLHRITMKILINIPKIYGGISNHYWGLRPYWSEHVKYNAIGRRSWKKWSGLFWLPYDIVKFINTILFWRPDCIVLNPSFDHSAMFRDLQFLKIAIFLRKKTVVFIHGWDKEYEIVVNKKKLASYLNRVHNLMVLAEEFRKSLIAINVQVPIYLITTKVDDRLLQNFNITCRTGKIDTLLFLARVEKAKGVFTVLDAYRIMKKKYPKLKLRIVGDGQALKAAKEYANGIKDILFTGKLTGEQLANEFIYSDIYILPTHGEGMPASVLEAMAFGLPVITRPVGGIVDFFTDAMGTLVDGLNPDDYIPVIEKYINNPQLTKATSIYNYNFAIQNFLASAVAKKMENILEKC
jgi:glycosyltransferase involved in cell wall biosynthesis